MDSIGPLAAWSYHRARIHALVILTTLLCVSVVFVSMVYGAASDIEIITLPAVVTGFGVHVSVC